MKYSILPPQKLQVTDSLYKAPANTFYENSFDKLFGNYKVAWSDKFNDFTVKSALRIQDFEGHRPNFSSTKYIIPAIQTYMESREDYIIKHPLPFIVFEAINKLEDILNPYDKVLEFGSGNSTVWFLKQLCRLTSIEHSKTWAGAVKAFIDKEDLDAEAMRNFDFKLSQDQDTLDYVNSLPDESFDMIFVDSSNGFNNRNVNLKNALPKLKNGGWMVLDNSDHPNNWPGGVFMDSMFKRIRFTGYTPMGLYVSQTSFWKKC